MEEINQINELFLVNAPTEDEKKSAKRKMWLIMVLVLLLALVVAAYVFRKELGLVHAPVAPAYRFEFF